MRCTYPLPGKLGVVDINMSISLGKQRPGGVHVQFMQENRVKGHYVNRTKDEFIRPIAWAYR